MKVQLKKVLALVLIFCLLLSAVPVWAANGEPAQSVEETSVVSQTEQSQTTTQEELATPDTSAEVTVVREEESLRGEFEKHFLMSDGTYQAVVYSYPVHELVNGVWVELPIPEQTARGDVSPGNAQQNIIDNYVWQNHGVQDNNSVRLYIGKRSGNECRAFIRFATMPTIPAGATITAATMKVNIVSGTSTAYNAKASQVTGSWESATIQWSNMPTIGSVLEDNISHNNKTKYQFSCLTAVQHWYDGSTTGQNENYGIMLQYADSTIADYNSFYSADCTDSTMRPSMTISYQPLNSDIRLDVGNRVTLSVTGATGVVTWTSSNTSIATVNPYGLVTGIQVGEATITAYVGGLEFKKFTVNVTIADGVYYIRNSGGAYMGTSGRIADGTKVSLYAQATSGRAQLNQLWRIDYLGTGYYSIRPLYNMNMGLCSENGVPGDAVITNIGASDKLADVPATNRWSISRTANGLEFYCAGTSYMTLCADQPYTGAKVVTKIGTTNLSGRYWSLEKVTDIPMQVLLMDAQTGASVSGITYYINRGETITLDELGIVATFVCSYSLDPSVSWYSQNPANISIDRYTGTMTANIPDGNTTIYAKHIHNGVEYNQTFTVIVNRPMTQFIENMGILYDIAYLYEDGDQTKALETMFNFIRGQRYSGTMWEGIAGVWNTQFVDIIETYLPDLYSYFICESPDDSSEYDIYSVNNSSESNIYMVADTCSDECLDVIHMAATLNRLFYTGETSFCGINTHDMLDEVADALSGWAGDCQTLIQDYYDCGNSNGSTDEVYETFYPMIGNAAYHFNYSDILSDVDACNLYSLLSSQSITSGEQLETVLNGYYSGTVGNVAAKRFTTWIGSYTQETLRNKFFDYCNDYSEIVLVKWPFLVQYSIYPEQQQAFSRAFADYFWEQVAKE